MDRVPDSGPGGRGFDSHHAHYSSLKLKSSNKNIKYYQSRYVIVILYSGLFRCRHSLK